MGVRTQVQELKGKSLLLFASALGLTTGMSATMFYSLGAFIPSLQQEFGWSRSELSFGATVLTLSLFIVGSFVGRLCDRYGAALVGTVSLVSHALAIVLLASQMNNLYQFWIGYFVIAVLGAGSTPIVMVRPISACFDRARGFSLGLALTGAGVAGFWVPRLVAGVVETYGWREAYYALAAVALAASPIVWAGFRHLPELTPHQTFQQTQGDTHSAARRTAVYWLLSAIGLMMALGVAGIIVHLIPIFIDLGLTMVNAAAIASILGITSVVGRLVIGYLLDHLPMVLVSSAVLLLASTGIFLLWQFGLQFAWLATALLGLAAGAEVDLIAYLTVSYFGRRHYGAIYGCQYSVFIFGYGLSPWLLGMLHDVYGSYQRPLMFSTFLAGLAVLLCLALPKTQRA